MNRTPVLSWLILVICLGVMPVSPLRAEVIVTSTDLTITNAPVNGPFFLIASDGLNAAAGYNRDALRLRSVTRYARSGQSSFAYEYELRYSLANSAGVAQALFGGTGPGNTLVVFNESVNVAVTTPATRTNVVVITPSDGLDPDDTYHVHLTIARRVANSGAAYVDTGVTDESNPRQILRFPDTNPSDATLNALPVLVTADWWQTYNLIPDPEDSGFKVRVRADLWRYDAWTTPVASANVRIRFNLELRDSANKVIPLKDSTTDIVRSLASYEDQPGTAPHEPSRMIYEDNLVLDPIDQIDSVNQTYTVRVTVGHFATDNAALPTASNDRQTAAVRLLHFNGNLYFGDIKARFISLAAPIPAPGPIDASGLSTSIAVDDNSGFIASP